MSTGLSRELADFITATRLTDVPDDLRRYLRDDLADIAGCVIYGHQAPSGPAIVDYARGLGEPGDAAIWGSTARAGAATAALAMGTLGHSYDFDDYHPEAKIHPAAVVATAATALAEQRGVTGAALLGAIAVGFETAIRVSLATGPVPTMLAGFHLTGVCGTVGAAAAAARLYDLGSEAIAHALGLAASQGAGLMGFVYDGSTTKRLHAGRAAQSGIQAAALAAHGLTAPERAFELPHGGLFHAHSPEPDPDALTRDLGTRWATEDLSLKRYSCCGSIHSTLDLVGQAVAELDAEPEQVEAIEVHHSPAVLTQCGAPYEPSDAVHALMNLRYCVAALLLEGAVQPAQFRPELLHDPRVPPLAERVRTYVDPYIERVYPARFAAHIVLRAWGRAVELRTDHPKGAAANPLTTAEIDDKFRRLTDDRLTPERQDAALDTIRRIEEVPVRDLTAHLVPD